MKWMAVIGLVTFSAMAVASTVVHVSTDGFNRFTFATPFNQVVLPPKTPLASKPVAMQGNKTLLLSFKDTLKKAVQMVVQTTGGDVVDLKLIPGAETSAEWSQPTNIKQQESAHPHEKSLIKLFKEVVADPNHTPEGFQRGPTPDKGRIKGLVADYIANYRSQNYHILAMRLRSKRRAHILPQDLYVRGVSAVYIDGDTVGPQIAPLAVVLKTAPQNQGR